MLNPPPHTPISTSDNLPPLPLFFSIFIKSIIITPNHLRLPPQCGAYIQCMLSGVGLLIMLIIHCGIERVWVWKAKLLGLDILAPLTRCSLFLPDYWAWAVASRNRCLGLAQVLSPSVYYEFAPCNFFFVTVHLPKALCQQGSRKQTVVFLKLKEWRFLCLFEVFPPSSCLWLWGLLRVIVTILFVIELVGTSCYMYIDFIYISTLFYYNFI